MIKGLLAAIGIILILKQIPHVLGHDLDPEGDLAFFQAAIIGTPFPNSRIWPAICIPAPPPSAWSRSPCCSSGIGGRDGNSPGCRSPWWSCCWVLDSTCCSDSSEDVGSSRRATSCKSRSSVICWTFVSILQHPDFSQWANPAVYLAAVTIAAIASLESLVNLEAIDKLDPQKRISPPSRQLWV